MRNAIATAIVAVAIAAALAGQAQAPPWVGAWELDPAQSEYRAGAVAARETMTIVPYVGAYKIAINRTDLGGGSAQTEAIARFDGTDVLAIGFKVPTTRAFTTVDDRTFEIADKVNGLVTLRRRAAVSVDGRTLTLTEHGVDEGGQNVDAVLRFVRGGAGGIGPGTGGGIASPPLAGVVRVGSPGVTIPRLLKDVKPQVHTGCHAREDPGRCPARVRRANRWHCGRRQGPPVVGYHLWIGSGSDQSREAMEVRTRDEKRRTSASHGDDRADLHVGQRLRGRDETDRWCLVRGRPCDCHASSCG